MSTDQIELCTLDLRYASYRMRHRARESALLESIRLRGIETPLEGTTVGERAVLLNGFKRVRCAQALDLRVVPYRSLGADEAQSIIRLLRVSNDVSLSILEQAVFLEDLKSVHQMDLASIAADVRRSKAWVSMRLNLLREMSEPVRRELFSGAFPVYSYMYTLRRFMRMNGVKADEIEQFVLALSGTKLSVREIEQLAHGFFRGPTSFRDEILNGHASAALERIKRIPRDVDGCSEFERVMLADLQRVQTYMQRTMGKGLDKRLKSRAFFAEAHLLIAGILSRRRSFDEAMRNLHDRSAEA